jgi:rhodanese-related sulfurtransferase
MIDVLVKKGDKVTTKQILGTVYTKSSSGKTILKFLVYKNATKMNFFDANFNAQLTKLDKNKPVYVYCKSGRRSGKTTKKMKEMGFTTVYNLNGGFGAWAGAGNDIVK